MSPVDPCIYESSWFIYYCFILINYYKLLLFNSNFGNYGSYYCSNYGSGSWYSYFISGIGINYYCYYYYYIFQGFFDAWKWLGCGYPCAYFSCEYLFPFNVNLELQVSYLQSQEIVPFAATIVFWCNEGSYYCYCYYWTMGGGYYWIYGYIIYRSICYYC